MFLADFPALFFHIFLSGICQYVASADRLYVMRQARILFNTSMFFFHAKFDFVVANGRTIFLSVALWLLLCSSQPVTRQHLPY